MSLIFASSGKDARDMLDIANLVIIKDVIPGATSFCLPHTSLLLTIVKPVSILHRQQSGPTGIDRAS